jgi:CheY-like chemotaxis protein
MVAEAETAKTPYDVILMDLQMPIMDGIEATRTLRHRGFSKPIVALTANLGTSEQAVEAGCNLVLSKPADRAVLLKTIVNLTQKAT